MADISQIKLPSGNIYDIIDEKSGYITAQYIENKTDYSIPVSRVGEIVVGETAIGTDSTNFPTSKAVVDYVDERVVQEIDAIDVGVTGIKANGTSLAVENGVVNIPAISPGQPVGLITEGILDNIYNYIHHVSDSIPASTSQLTNDSGFITSEADPIFSASSAAGINTEDISNWNNKADIYDITTGVGDSSSSSTFYIRLGNYYGNYEYTNFMVFVNKSQNVNNTVQIRTTTNGSQLEISKSRITINGETSPTNINPGLYYGTLSAWSDSATLTLASAPKMTDIPTVPTNISSFTNDSGYLTASDIASVMTYKGTKANYAALPSTGNTTGDVWHLTDTGAEWAWDGSAWQELGTAIDLSNYLTTSDIAAWAKASTKPTYTAAEVGALPDTTTIPSKTSDLTNDSGFVKRFVITITGNDADGYSADKTFSEIITAHNNGYEVICIGPYGSTIPSLQFDTKMVLFELSAMTVDNTPAGEFVRINASNETSYSFLRYIESDPTVPSWAKQSSKPTYTAAEVGALPASTVIPTKTSELDNDSGFLTTDSDENVKQNEVDVNDKYNYPLLFSDNYSYGNKITGTYKTSSLIFNPKSSLLTASNIQIGGLRAPGSIKLGYLTISAVADTSANTINFPNASGTIALTSDLPDTSSFLTSETDPVFSASSAAGISAEDISNWDDKAAIWTVGSGHASSDYWWTLAVSRSALYKITNAPGSDGYLKSIKVPSVNGSQMVTLDLPTTNGKLALTSQIPTVPTNISAFTNDSGYLTSYTETDPVFSASAAAGITSTDISNWNGKAAGDHQHGNISNEGHITTYGSITSGSRLIFAKSNTWAVTMAPASMAFGSDSTKYLANDGTWQSIPDTSSFLTSETDPVFTASAAAGITATDISNWNAKVSDTGKWNGVELANFETATANDYYVPAKTTVGSTSGTASWLKVTRTPGNYSIAQYDNGYLKSTTPSANDNSTKVATTAYVDAAIPKVYSSTNTGGYLTMATLPIYDGTVV